MTWRYVGPPLVAWGIAQVLKLITLSVRERHLDFRALATMGGMPSSHSAMVCCLTTVIGRVNGTGSSAFAVALIFSLVVMYDAAGVRHAAGRQAMVLNRLVEDLFAQRGHADERLRELLGHTPVEVFAGAALGIVAGLAAP